MKESLVNRIGRTERRVRRYDGTRDRRRHVCPAEHAVIRRGKMALTQFWCSLTSGRSANQPSLKQIDLGPPIHLPFDQLEFRDLSFGLAVRPR